MLANEFTCQESVLHARKLNQLKNMTGKKILSLRCHKLRGLLANFKRSYFRYTKKLYAAQQAVYLKCWITSYFLEMKLCFWILCDASLPSVMVYYTRQLSGLKHQINMFWRSLHYHLCLSPNAAFCLGVNFKVVQGLDFK